MEVDNDNHYQLTCIFFGERERGRETGWQSQDVKVNRECTALYLIRRCTVSTVPCSCASATAAPAEEICLHNKLNK